MANALVIEPDTLLAQIYAHALRSAGHEVSVATTAQAAIDAADVTTPDVVLLELQLVAHSGIEFLYEFRSYPEWRAIPAIILSHVPPAEFAQSTALLRTQLDVCAHYYKPQLSLEALLRIVEATVVQT